MDAKILEIRLVTRESALYIPSVSKCASKVQVLLSTRRDDRHWQEARDSLSRELQLYKIEMTQVQETIQMHDRELLEFQNLERRIEADIASVEANILTLRRELHEQKKLRKHKEECEILARLVNTLTPQA